MAYNSTVAERIRKHLADFPGLHVEEKNMFGGRCFMINGKMCVNVSGDNLMCRFDPERYEELASKKGFSPMIMKGQEMKGYCYVAPEGFKSENDFKYWMEVCLSYNEKALPSRKKK